MIDPDVVTVLRAVPQFAERYLDLVEEADGDPGAAAAFAELAEFAAGLATGVDRRRRILGHLLAAVEEVAASSPEAEAHVGWAFLDSLSRGDRATGALARAEDASVRHPGRARSRRRGGGRVA